jgi:GntP family gluconate:H+ symporter
VDLPSSQGRINPLAVPWECGRAEIISDTVMSICAGGIVTHCLVPPTHGPVAMSAALGFNLGVMILIGAVVGVFKL